MQKDSSRRRFPLADRVIEVIDDTLTGEVLLDEALKMMKSSEKMSVNSWIDLMSGTKKKKKVSLQFAQQRGVLTRQSRRNMEFDEDWLSAEASARTSRQGPGR